MDLPRNQFKRRLLSGEQQIGLWVTIPDTGVAEAMAGAGFDWLVIDTEHTPIEVSKVQAMLQAVAPYPVSPVVRPVANDTAILKRHLDQGAQTLLVPYVQTVEEARAAAAAVRYAPKGVRGVAGTHRASGYGRVADYHGQADAEICLIVQAETLATLDRLEEIAAVDGVDAVFIGPADLATTMGHPGQAGHPEVKAKVLEAIGRLKAVGTPAGVLTLDADFARECMAAGTTFTAVGVDFTTLVRAVDALAAAFKG